jgi:hypothetical protein
MDQQFFIILESVYSNLITPSYSRISFYLLMGLGRREYVVHEYVKSTNTVGASRFWKAFNNISELFVQTI